MWTCFCHSEFEEVIFGDINTVILCLLGLRQVLNSTAVIILQGTYVYTFICVYIYSCKCT